MRAVRLPVHLAGKIGAHARQTYPDECCGFLIAEPDPTSLDVPRVIVDAVPAANEFEGERRRRFLLRPAELRSAESRLEGTGRVVAGFYHSHPDHPARPSQFDQEHAWPWYTYLVLSVTSDGPKQLRAFELDPERLEFRETELTIPAAEPSALPAMAGG